MVVVVIVVTVDAVDAAVVIVRNKAVIQDCTYQHVAGNRVNLPTQLFE